MDIVATAQFNFPSNQLPAERTLTSTVVNGTTTLLSTSPTVVSTLTLTATTQLDGLIVECAGVTTDESVVISITSMSLLSYSHQST